MALGRDELVTFLKDSLDVDMDNLAHDAPLFSSGEIDSFSLVSLIEHIEKECGFRVKPTEVSLDNMDSVDRLMAYIDRKCAEAN